MPNCPDLPRARTARRVRMLAACAAALLALVVTARAAHAQALDTIDIPGPAGSGAFGASVTVLPNGNFVVTDPSFDDSGTADVGAVHLYDGVTLQPISTLKGSAANDRVGGGGVTVLANGNYLVLSPGWGGTRGAVTWGDGATGMAGEVSAANSLIGAPGDYVGSSAEGEIPAVRLLPNGAYLVSSPDWNGKRGAVTWGSGTAGVAGEVSADTSLVGSQANDRVGSADSTEHVRVVLPPVYVTVLANGNYVVSSPAWDNGGTADAGAATWGDGAVGVRGEVSAGNSLVGSTAHDRVGDTADPIGEEWYLMPSARGVTALPNGNYVVRSHRWDNGALANAGAATWADGTTGIAGPVTALNSLVGGEAGAQVGYHGVFALANGHYAVSGLAITTWGSGVSGVAGLASAANSLLSGGTVTPLPDGNYVVGNPVWGDDVEGAATWCDGLGGTVGTVSAANSLIGTQFHDNVGGSVTVLSNGNYVAGGSRSTTWGSAAGGIAGEIAPTNSLMAGGKVVALANGNYVVSSELWKVGGRTSSGFAAWGSGLGGTAGELSAANSLVGTQSWDLVSYHGVLPLPNGNYIVRSGWWNNGDATRAGAVTWGDGASGVAGPVSAGNSLVGTTTGDRVGGPIDHYQEKRVIVLPNSSYVVTSPGWDDGTLSDVGMAAWADGAQGIAGTVTPQNSLIGSTPGDMVGWAVQELGDGNAVVSSPWWDDGATADAGAVTWVDGTVGVRGVLSGTYSLVGAAQGDSAGSGGVLTLPGGGYVVFSPLWGAGDEGAVSLARGGEPLAGAVSAANSVLGTAAGGGEQQSAVWNEAHQYVVVGRPADNVVTAASYGFNRMILTIVGRMESESEQ